MDVRSMFRDCERLQLWHEDDGDCVGVEVEMGGKGGKGDKGDKVGNDHDGHGGHGGHSGHSGHGGHGGHGGHVHDVTLLELPVDNRMALHK